MKLNPKGTVFCPGCPKKLSLKTAPQLIIQPEKHNTKTITILHKSNKPKQQKSGLF